MKMGSSTSAPVEISAPFTAIIFSLVHPQQIAFGRAKIPDLTQPPIYQPLHALFCYSVKELGLAGSATATVIGPLPSFSFTLSAWMV